MFTVTRGQWNNLYANLEHIITSRSSYCEHTHLVPNPDVTEQYFAQGLPGKYTHSVKSNSSCAPWAELHTPASSQLKAANTLAVRGEEMGRFSQTMHENIGFSSCLNKTRVMIWYIAIIWLDYIVVVWQPNSDCKTAGNYCCQSANSQGHPILSNHSLFLQPLLAVASYLMGRY